MDHEFPRRGVSRRRFFGASALGAAAVAGAPTTTPAATTQPPPKICNVSFSVNGATQRLVVEPRWSLLYVLRDRLNLTGTKMGCGRGECGACTVLMDGQSRYACTTLAVEAEGTAITTVEGLLSHGELGNVQKAFAQEDALQCGYCTPGQIMAAEALLRKVPRPSMEQIRTGMSGNLCRCGAYAHIFQAVHRAAGGMA